MYSLFFTVMQSTLRNLAMLWQNKRMEVAYYQVLYCAISYLHSPSNSLFFEVELLHFGIAYFALNKMFFAVKPASKVRPSAALALAIKLTIISYLQSVSPHKFDVIRENSRCSVLFDLLVPGGK